MRVLVLLLILSCSSEPEPISKLDLYKYTKNKTNKLEIVLPKNINAGVKCKNYGPGCLSGVIGKAYGLEFFIVQFENQSKAKTEAMRIDAYYYNNWLFDEVVGEPKLERFIEKIYPSSERPLRPNKKTELN